MTRAALIAVLAIGVAGCTTTTWEKPGASATQKRVDLAQCEYEAEQGSPIIGSGVDAGLQAGYRKSQLRQLCLQARGYQQASAQ